MALRQYAGDFDCSECSQKRLTASSFSKSMVNKKRSDANALMRCLECVAKVAAAERQAALERSRNASAIPDDVDTPLECKACARELPHTSFSVSQRRKGDNGRCTSCIVEAEESEQLKILEGNVQALKAAQDRHVQLDSNASGTERLLAAASETAEEAKFVTGLNPVKLGRRGRGGSWRARGRGRGAATLRPPL